VAHLRRSAGQGRYSYTRPTRGALKSNRTGRQDLGPGLGTPHGDNHDVWIQSHHKPILIQTATPAGRPNVSSNGLPELGPRRTQTRPTASFIASRTDSRWPYWDLTESPAGTTSKASRCPSQGAKTTEALRAVGRRRERLPSAVDPRNATIHLFAGNLRAGTISAQPERYFSGRGHESVRVYADEGKPGQARAT